MKLVVKLLALLAVVFAVAACTPNHGNPSGTGQGYPDDPKAGDQ